MKIYSKKNILGLSLIGAFVFLALGPQKSEATSPADQKNMAPLTQPTDSSLQNEEHTLSPKEEDQLIIDEDNVMNPFPG